MGYRVLKQGWRLIAILAIGFSSGCSGNEKIKGIDLDEVGYGFLRSFPCSKEKIMNLKR